MMFEWVASAFSFCVFCQYDQLNELRNKFDASSKRQDELLEMFSPQALQDNVKVAALEAEEAAEAVAEDFLEGEFSDWPVTDNCM